MARPVRIEYPGALYHVTSRGNEAKDIFVDDHDRRRFKHYLSECWERYGIVVYCYVLMSNHYHLLVETPYGDLHKVMHTLNGSYSIYFNRRHERIGHLLQGRYKAILVDKEAYLLILHRYIHLNPVRAGLVRDPADYEWSTFPAYIGAAKKEEWVNYAAILQMFSGEENRARERYLSFVGEGIGQEDKSPLENLHGQILLGSKPFVHKIKKMLDKGASRPDIAEHKNVDRQLSPDRIIGTIEHTLQVDRRAFLRQGNRDNTARKLALLLVKRYTSLNNQEIAKLFGGIHCSTVSKACKRFEQELREDASVHALYQKIKAQVCGPL